MSENEVFSFLNHFKEPLKQIVSEAVHETLSKRSDDLAPGRLAISEAEAANLLGVRQNVLRDARYRGEIVARVIGRRIFYMPEDLQAFLHNQRWERS